MAIVGPGAQQEVISDRAGLLDGANDFEYITILNPLTDDFAVRVAQDIPVNMPVEIRDKTGLIQSSGDVTRTYGLDLKNPDFKSQKHISNDTVIKAGETINLKGSEAQVAVRQIVNELLQREGKQRMMMDPEVRRRAEERVIISRGSIQDLMDGRIQSQTAQIDAAINKSNEVQDGQAFPDLTETAGGDQTTPETSGQFTPDDSAPLKRGPGRPAKV